jgi:hypothetical protein
MGHDEGRGNGYHRIPFGKIFINIVPKPVADKSPKALQVYTKAVPKATYVDIEKKMREEKFLLYTIAVVSLLLMYIE